MVLLQHVEGLSRLDRGVGDALEELHQFQGNLRIHLFGVFKIEVEARSEVDLGKEVIQDIHLVAESLDGSLTGDDTARKVGEEGVNLVVAVLKRIENGVQKAGQTHQISNRENR